MKREEILNNAIKCVTGNREQDYGTPEDNFTTISKLWTAYLSACGRTPADTKFSIRPHDVAAMMILVKIARISSGHGKDDNWVDIAGYSACGGELESLLCQKQFMSETVQSNGKEETR